MSQDSNKDKLAKLLAKGRLEPYIRYIRFPSYKNLSPNTRLDFLFPITALVGANGTNKSSVLRALFGAPGYNNLGNLWFSTSIDPIAERKEAPSCFIYGYLNDHYGSVVEVLKTRVRKERDPDYWEPSRPILKYGMDKMPEILDGEPIPQGRSKTRWDNIDKNVEYIDFRDALSAFDKFFYHGELRGKASTPKNKKEFIRSRAPHLKRVIDLGLSSFVFRRKERIVNSENIVLTEAQRVIVSKILGREYSEIKIVRHTFFNCDAYTCLMRSSNMQYSEAFAGSGEFAVVRIVLGMMKAPEKSLILIDEPEVSLHPGAQDRLVDFLYESVKTLKHQVVMSTHSPAIVRRLPPEAIKVFALDPVSHNVNLMGQSALPGEAFFYIGEPVPGKKIVLVEDALAGAVVKRALHSCGEAVNCLFDVQFYPGGSQTLWGHYLPIFAAEYRDDILVMFDGDKRPVQGFSDPGSISEVEEELLREEILRVTGVDINFKVDGGRAGADTVQLNQVRRKFVSWARSHVRYLPGMTPEEFVWETMKQDAISESITDSDAKVRFEKLTKIGLGLALYESVDSKEILTIQRQRLASISDDNPELSRLRGILLRFAGYDEDGQDRSEVASG